MPKVTFHKHIILKTMEITINPKGEITIPAGTTGKVWKNKYIANKEKIQRAQKRAAKQKHNIIIKI